MTPVLLQRSRCRLPRGSHTRGPSRDWSYITRDEGPLRMEVKEKAHAGGYASKLCTLLDCSHLREGRISDGQNVEERGRETGRRRRGFR